jgi:hypothetical protein
MGKDKNKDKDNNNNVKEIKVDNEIKSDSLLRDTSGHYIRLIGDADRKARIMIVVNSIFLTISVTYLTKFIHIGKSEWISVMILIIANMLSLFFTILSIRPEIHGKEGEKEAEDNILHFKKCSEYPLAEYRAKILVTLTDNDKKLEALIKELHFFGNVLTRQYKLMKISYRFFYWGLSLAVLSYLVILMFTGVTKPS